MTNRFFTPDEWNHNHKANQANCLGYAIGEAKTINLDWERYTIAEAFRMKVSTFGIGIRKVKSVAETKGHRAFLVYGFYYYKDPMLASFMGEAWQGDPCDFHIARIEPDGKVYHKPDRFEPAAEVTDFNQVTGGFGEYPEGPAAIFVII